MSHHAPSYRESRAQKGRTLWNPFFFLLVDSWLLSAGFAGVVELAGWAVPGSATPALGVGLSDDDDAAGSAELVAGCAANELLLPGVTVSTAAVLPAPPNPVIPSVGGPPKLRVSSPVSLAGVIVGAPV